MRTAPESRIGGLLSTGKINCEFLAMDGWQFEGEEQCSFCHDGCGVAEVREALVSTAICYVNLAQDRRSKRVRAAGVLKAAGASLQKSRTTQRRFLQWCANTLPYPRLDRLQKEVVRLRHNFCRDTATVHIWSLRPLPAPSGDWQWE
jgi:hypothetical protein